MMTTNINTAIESHASILLVEDDASLAEWILQYLRGHNYQLQHIDRGDQVLAAVKQQPPELIILDVMLPYKNGFDLCRELRAFYHGPILMLTACGEESDEILGLELGANDYLTKPVRPRVLLARIKALLRREAAEPVETVTQDGQLQFGQLKILRDAKSVFYRNELIPVTANEFDVLWVLASQAGKVIRREALVTQLRGIEYDGFDRSIDIRISRLRKKLFDNTEQPFRIKTIWAKGYLFSPEAWE
jgi:two-component system OmpR family response regulator/two-component system response regulator RstA